MRQIIHVKKVFQLSSPIIRIKEFIDFKGISFSEFEISLGVSRGLFSRALKNGTSVGSDKIEKIHSIYPELNIGWLMTGIGSMLIDKNLTEKRSRPVKDDTAFFNDRMKKYLSIKGISHNQFYKLTGLANGALSAKNMRSDSVEAIVSVFGDLNLEWLIRGEGAMLKVPPSKATDKQRDTKQIATLFPSNTAKGTNIDQRGNMNEDFSKHLSKLSDALDKAMDTIGKLMEQNDRLTKSIEQQAAALNKKGANRNYDDKLEAIRQDVQMIPAKRPDYESMLEDIRQGIDAAREKGYLGEFQTMKDNQEQMQLKQEEMSMQYQEHHRLLVELVRKEEEQGKKESKEL